MHCSLSLLSALSALSILGVAAQEDTGNINCVDGCFNELTTQFTTFQCGSATDKACLCQSQEFKFGVRDCSKDNCGASEDQVFEKLSSADNLCGPFPSTEDPEPTTQQTEASEPTSAEPTSEEPPATDAASEPVSTTAEPTAEPTETSIEPEITSEPTPVSEVTESTATSETSTSETATGASASETATADENEGEEEEEEDDNDGEAAAGGLSQGAAVGIGVGVAVCVVAVAVVAIILFMRYRRSNQKTAPSHDDISRPMPGAAARSSPSFDQGSIGEKRVTGDSIELTTNRYEDMVPRTVPRTMV